MDRILRAEAPEVDQLIQSGWRITARSFGAQLRGEDVNVQKFEELIARIRPIRVRELLAGDSPAILELDQATEDDYPGGTATSHTLLDTQTSVPTLTHPAYGAFTEDGQLAGMTFVDVVGPDLADTDFTVVAPRYRRGGLATALKAASILQLLERGITTFRTGGSAENVGIQIANSVLGYRIDEQWVTLSSGKER
ncbi:hypothetical protein [Ancrocorticia sp.]|uniref:hypothetical protein n=1 Tax=Ancrocorticia sp. TaxID=2593684 RepID=UPI003F93A9F5